jgi:hypothetical protein
MTKVPLDIGSGRHSDRAPRRPTEYDPAVLDGVRVEQGRRGAPVFQVRWRTPLLPEDERQAAIIRAVSGQRLDTHWRFVEPGQRAVSVVRETYRTVASFDGAPAASVQVRALPAGVKAQLDRRRGTISLSPSMADPNRTSFPTLIAAVRAITRMAGGAFDSHHGWVPLSVRKEAYGLGLRIASGNEVQRGEARTESHEL